MSTDRIEGKERKEYGKAEEKIGKDLDDENRKLAGEAEKEYGKTQEKIGKKEEKKGMI